MRTGDSEHASERGGKPLRGDDGEEATLFHPGERTPGERTVIQIKLPTESRGSPFLRDGTLGTWQCNSRQRPNHAQHREGSKDARRPPSGGDSPPRVATRRGVAQTRPCGDRARQGGLPGRGKITQVHRAGGWMVRTRDATRRTPGDPVVQGAEAVMPVPLCLKQPSLLETTSVRYIFGGVSP